MFAIQPNTRQTDAQVLHSKHTASLSPDARRKLLPLNPCRHRHRLNKVEFGFGVRELFELFDLQAPVFVGNEVCDEERFADTLNPE